MQKSKSLGDVKGQIPAATSSGNLWVDLSEESVMESAVSSREHTGSTSAGYIVLTSQIFSSCSGVTRSSCKYWLTPDHFNKNTACTPARNPSSEIVLFLLKEE